MARINIVLFKSKQLKSGKHPIYFDVSHEGKRKYFPVIGNQIAATIDEWDNSARLLKRKKNNPIIDEHNAELLKQKQHLVEIITEFEKTKVPWSFKMLEERREHKPVSGLWYEIVDKYIEAKKHKPTKDLHQSYKNVLKKYIGVKYEKLTCSDIDYTFISDWYDHMCNQNDIGLSHDTIRGRFKFINGCLNMAIREKVASVETHPFIKKPNGRYFDMKKLKRVKTHKTLPTKYIHELLNYKCYSEHDLHWQMFLFSLLGKDVPYKTLCTLKKKDIQFYEDNDSVKRQGFKFYHPKYRKTVISFLTPDMNRIIKDIQANYETFNDYVFPILIFDYTDESKLEIQLNTEVKIHNNKLDHCRRNSPILYNFRRKNDPDHIKELMDVRFIDKYRKLSILIFSFSHFAQGMNLIDMVKLKESNIKTTLDQDGNLIRYIQYIRSKTKQEILVPIIPQLQTILDYFEDHRDDYPKIGTYLLPLAQKNYANTDSEIYKRVYSIRTSTNANLKMIAENLGWDDEAQNISLYWARHTFAQRSLMAGASKESIQHSLGHRDLATTETYIEGFEMYQKRDFNTTMFENDNIAI